MPSTTVKRPIPAKISPGLSAFFMAAGSAQIPRLACRAVGLGGRQARGAVLVGHVGRDQRLALRQQLRLHRACRSRRETRRRAGGRNGPACRLRRASVTSRPAMIADSAAVRFAWFVGRDRLDAGEADLAAVLEAKAARIDHRGDAAFALRLERAAGRDARGCVDDAARTPQPTSAMQRDSRASSMSRCCSSIVPAARHGDMFAYSQIIPLSGKTRARTRPPRLAAAASLAA